MHRFGYAAAAALVIGACESSTEPRSADQPLPYDRPIFSNYPDGTYSNRGCGLHDAWAYDAHFQVTPSVSFSLAQCGNISFTDVGAWIEFRYQKNTGEADSTSWRQRLRFSDDARIQHTILAFEYAPAGQWLTRRVDVFLDRRLDGLMVDASFDNVPVAFGLDPELWSWIWNFMREPDSVRVSTVDTIVTLTWVNRHGRRAIDGTLVWRRNANTDAVVRAFTLGPQETSIVDTTTSGQWRYELRHRQDKLHAVMEAEMWSDPVYVNVGYPAPQGLWCIGHFAAVVDCTWTNGTNAAPVEVLRDGTSLTVLPAGSTSHSDATLVRNSSYTYTVRHTENGYPSPSSSPVTVTAPPQPPSLDSCGDSSPTAIHCYWSGWEGAAQTEVWRSTGARFSLIATKAPGVTDHLDEGLTTGTTYYYKVRYLQNGEVSDWSNTQVQDAGGIGPQSVGDKKF